MKTIKMVIAALALMISSQAFAGNADSLARDWLLEGPNNGNGRQVTALQTWQNISASWVNVGSSFPTQGATVLGVFYTLGIQSSSNVRFRIVGHTSSTDTLAYPIMQKAFSASDPSSVPVDDQYFELNVDESQTRVLPIEILNVLPYAQLQVSAGTVGATAASINTVKIFLGR